MKSRIFSIVPLACLLGQSSAFHGTTVHPPSATASSSSALRMAESKKSVSEQTQTNNFIRKKAGTLTDDSVPAQGPTQPLPPLDPAWIRAARQPCAWDAAPAPATDGESSAEGGEDASPWQSGQRWFATREALMDMWVLPRDVSKGSWDNYADAASRAEEVMLNQVPQLLRLEPSAVVRSARAVLNDLELPPVLLRKEPILLTMESERLKGAFESLRLRIATSDDAVGDVDVTTTAIGVATHTPGLLVKIATRWTAAVEDDDASAAAMAQDDDEGPEQGNKADNLKLLQQSFDNEVFASDLHMESFLDSKNNAGK